MTARDRLVIVAVLVAAGLAGFWFLGLAPKRKESASLQTQIQAANTRLTVAQQKASQGETAKKRYDEDYADIARLGKAVPKSDALPSLLYQLQGASHNARIDFRSNASGEPHFLEANPLAGLHPHHSDLPILAAQNGVPYVELIGVILDAGLARYGLARPGTERTRRRA